MIDSDSRRLNVSWSVEDVKHLRPKWSDERCQDVLDRVFEGLEEAAVTAGWDVLEWGCEDEGKYDDLIDIRGFAHSKRSL